ncbi:hypothetical protein SAMN03080617_00378 [Algoriphagus alkaliphilus]|uniref:Outer membrane porin, OprD family n=1 Tax=Algoriphagus alkaliphilus TaxID=279824 RepID=A0A1G5V9P8_9BACT|nr:hypothetical protein [Algoriphagus alkaliphilus]SDA42603.1 hypothetical protein SAMN03080617_00378 [Algoriphagus alkaliphilus]
MERFALALKGIGMVFIVLLNLSIPTFSQHHGEIIVDTTSNEKLFGDKLKTGNFEFHLRSFYMHTENQKGLLDYSTWGSGAGLGYFSPRWKGLGVGFSGFFVFRHFENNIILPDPATGLPNRYELTLFDVHHPDNYHDMDRLEEFFVSYEKEKFTTWVGRHHFESPLLNTSDNRMRPNLFSGISMEYQPGKLKFTGAWFTHLISRGSLKWLSVEESIGVYSTGRNPTGSDKNYHHHLESKGIGVLGIEFQTKDLQLKSWTYLSEGIFTTTFGEASGNLALANGSRFVYGAQGFYQTALDDGGNPDPSYAYTLPGEYTYGAGFRTGIHLGNSELTLNYLGISDSGRFLFPREWGREKFFVSMQRERFEGMGGVNAWGVLYDQTFIQDKLKVSLGASQVNTPDLENIGLNKYGLPNYYHFTGLVDYRFTGFFKGLVLQLLVVHKKDDSDRNIPLEFVINRVNMTNYNLILDYRF